MKYTEQDIQKVREIGIAGELGVVLNGRNKLICCPVHNDSTPSFLLDCENGYHCFGCNISGRGFIDFTTDFLMSKGVSKTDAFTQIMNEYVDRG